MRLVQLDILRFKDLESGIPLYAIIRVGRGFSVSLAMNVQAISKLRSKSKSAGQLLRSSNKG